MFWKHGHHEPELELEKIALPVEYYNGEEAPSETIMARPLGNNRYQIAEEIEGEYQPGQIVEVEREARSGWFPRIRL